MYSWPAEYIYAEIVNCIRLLSIFISSLYISSEQQKKHRESERKMQISSMQTVNPFYSFSVCITIEKFTSWISSGTINRRTWSLAYSYLNINLTGSYWRPIVVVFNSPLSENWHENEGVTLNAPFLRAQMPLADTRLSKQKVKMIKII